MIKDVRIEKATSAMIKAFYPEGPPHSCYAWIAYYKDKAACLAGVTLAKGGAIAFCDIKENDASPRTIFLTAKILLEKMKSLGLPMMATYCDPFNERRGQNFIKHLGFKYERTTLGVEIFKCQ